MKKVIAEFILSLEKRKKCNKGTIELYKKKLNDLEKFFSGFKDPGELTLENLKLFLDDVEKKGYSAHTYNLYISSLKLFFKYLSQAFELKDLGKSLKNKQKQALVYLPKDKIEGFLDKIEHVDDNRKTIFLLYVLCGLNTDKISKLKKQDILITDDKIGIKIPPKKEFEYFFFNENKYENSLKRGIKALQSTKRGFLFETSSKKGLTRPHFKYIFNKFKEYMPAECNSILKLKSQDLQLQKEINVDYKLIKYIGQRYRIEKLIGKGLSSNIYLAFDLSKKTFIALKLLKEENNTRENIKAFKDEFILLKELKHPLLPQVYDFAFYGENKSYYFTMEYFETPNLSHYAGKLKPKDIYAIMSNILALLVVMKDKNIKHHDINPSNILFSKSKEGFIELRLIDFGLVKDSEAKIKGTNFFIDPEILLQKKESASSDLYSFGMSIYHIITKSFPFSTSTFDEYLNDIKNNEYIKLNYVKKDLPLEFCNIISKMTAYNSKDRYQNEGEILKELNNFFENSLLSKQELSGKLTIKQASLTGNHELLRKIQNNFDIVFSKIKTKSDKVIITIVGETGSGKTRIINEFINQANLSEINSKSFSFIKFYSLQDIIDFCSCSITLEIENDEQSGDVKLTDTTTFIKKLSDTFISRIGNSDTLIYFDKCENINKIAIIFLRFLFDSIKEHKSNILFFFSLNSDLAKKHILLDTFLSKASRHIKVESFELERLSRKETNSLLEDIFNKSISNDFLDYVFKASGGNPAYITTLIPYLISKAQILIKNESIALHRIPTGYPKDIAEAISLRVKSLDKEGQKILFISTLFDLPLTIESISTILIKINYPLSKPELLLKLDYLYSKNFLSTSYEIKSDNEIILTKANKLFSISDEFSKQIISDLIPSKEASLIHKAIAQELESFDYSTEKQEEKIANHLLLAKDNMEALRIYNKLAQSNFSKGFLLGATNYYNIIINSLGAIDTKEKEALKINTLFELVKITLFTGDYNTAETHANGLSLFELNPNQELDLLKLKGQIKTNKGIYSEGISIYDMAILKACENQNDNKKTELLLLKVSALMGQSQFEACKLILNELKAKEILEDFHKIKLYNLSGLLNYYSGNFEKSIEEFKLSYDFACLLKEQSGIIASLNNMGLSSTMLGHLEDAINWHKEALNISEEFHQIRKKAQQCLNIGSNQLRMGLLQEALESYKESFDILENLDKPRETETATFNIALIYSMMGDIDNSSYYANESLALSKKRNNKLLLASNYSLLADLAFNKNDIERCKENYDKALELFKETNNKSGMADIYTNLALLEKKQGNIDKTYSLLKKATELLDKNVIINIETNIIKANIELDKESPLKAKDFLDQIESINADELYPLMKISYYEAFTRLYFFTKNVLKLEEYSKLLQNTIASIEEHILVTNLSNFNLLPKVSSAKELLSMIKLDRDGFSDINKLHKIFEINLSLSQEKDLNRLLNLILDNAILFSDAKRGFIILKEAVPTETIDLSTLTSFQVLAARNIHKEDIKQYTDQISNTIIQNTFLKENVLKISNAIENFTEAHSIQASNLKSVLSLPIVENNKVAGLIYLDDPTKIAAFDNIDKELMLTFASQVSIAISNTKHLKQLAQENIKINTEASAVKERLIVTEENYEKTKEALELSKRNEIQDYDYRNIITQSTSMFKIFETIDKVKDSDISVLITGESGTGKELIARAIHYNGNRTEKPFFAENCSALTESILETELFGYVKGAYTDANIDKRGLFELAHEGSLFLDEVGDMPISMQKKLLRAIQEKKIRRVGGNKIYNVDVRIISATHRDLLEMTKTETFRQDLYFRLNVIHIKLPSLRERPEDIPLLIEHFLNKHSLKQAKVFDKKLIDNFKSYSWPGNIRELENEIKKLIYLSNSNVIDTSLIDSTKYNISNQIVFKGKRLCDVEKLAIENVLKETDGNKSQAAKILAIDKKTLSSKIIKYDIKVNK
ncbi:MAG: sigma 54-interacting transcriptional regulator [Pseudomonadota bacterium]